MNPFVGAAKILTRLLAFIGRELVEVGRRPGALVSLVFGPFLVMAIFGLGFNGYRKPLPTILVIPQSSGLPSDAKTYQDLAGPGLQIVAVTTDAAKANAQLEAGNVEVVAIAPENAQQTFQSGQQSTIEVRIDVADPVEGAYAGLMANQFTAAVNREIIRRAAEQAQSQANSNGVPNANQIPPAVIAEPTKAQVVNVAPSQPTVAGYFGPAVLALILQHMAVTLIALSVVRERTSGVIELFRVSAVSAWEIVVGKVLGFGFLAAVIAVISVGLLVLGLGVPMLGSPALLAGLIALLIFASLGLGLLISIVSDSERQAVQLSLLILLASVFFSGFVIAIDQFTRPVEAAAYLLPATTGIQLLQDTMLRGAPQEPWQIGLLAILGVLLMLACWILLRRQMERS